MASAAKQDYVQWFGFNEELSVSKTEAGVSTLLPTGKSTLFVQELNPKEAEEFEIVKGREGERPQGWISRKYHSKVPRSTLGIRRDGKTKATFVTLFSLDMTATRSQVVYDKGKLSIRFDLGEAPRTSLVYEPGTSEALTIAAPEL